MKDWTKFTSLKLVNEELLEPSSFMSVDRVKLNQMRRLRFLLLFPFPPSLLPLLFGFCYLRELWSLDLEYGVLRNSEHITIFFFEAYIESMGLCCLLIMIRLSFSQSGLSIVHKTHL